MKVNLAFVTSQRGNGENPRERFIIGILLRSQLQHPSCSYDHDDEIPPVLGLLCHTRREDTGLVFLVYYAEQSFAKE